jgi:hypothetical protein
VPQADRLADMVQESSEDLIAGPLTLFGSMSRPGSLPLPQSSIADGQHSRARAALLAVSK